MSIHAENLGRLRHELRTSLNHIMGYSEILQEDAREYRREDIIPELKRIKVESEHIREYISENLDPEPDGTILKQPEEIKVDLYRHIYSVIGTARQIREKFQEDNTGFSLLDLDKILSASNTILDLIDTRLMDIIRDQNENEKADDAFDINDPFLFENDRDIRKNQETGTLLVVDDNEMNRDMLARHLERQGHTIVTSDNGITALEIVRNQPIDLVILDIMMPLMNGYQVLETIKSDKDLRHIPVIMISALDDMESVIRCIEMGAEDYLPKSFDPVLLRARIDASLEKKRLRDQEQVYVRAILESQKVLAGELSEAAEYVRNLLPPFLEGPVRTEWVFVPSAQLGGDSFGYHWLDQDTLALYLLDVSGHGIGAALLSVSVMNVLRTQSLSDTDFYSPGAVLTMLNKNFQMDAQNNMFFSIWYGVFNKETGELAYASAGAPPALLMISQDPSRSEAPGTAIRKLGTQDMIIGIREMLSYSTHRIHIPQHSRLFLFSDGAFEIRRSNGRMLTLEEFVNFLSVQNWDECCSLQFILNQLQGISMKDSFEDDVSILEVIFE